MVDCNSHLPGGFELWNNVEKVGANLPEELLDQHHLMMFCMSELLHREDV